MFILERFSEVIAPFNCVQCNREGKLVCGGCTQVFCLSLSPRCYRCLKLSKHFAICRQCAPRTLLQHVWIASQLSGPPEVLIHTFKFERAQAAALVVADLMVQVLPGLLPDTIIVPIPTATNRIRERGYDHAALLAQAVARKRGYTYKKALQRLGQSRQVGATRVQRFLQLRGTFRVKKPTAVKGSSILLVDDVVTTGATLEEAARVLHKVGAKRIDALVFAQK